MAVTSVADYCGGWTRKMAVTSVAESSWLLRWLDQEDGCYVCGWQQLITAVAGPGRWLLHLWLRVADYCAGWTRKMAVNSVAESSWLLHWLDQEDGCYVCGWQQLITAVAGPGRWLLHLWLRVADYCAGWTRKMAVNSVAESSWLLRLLDQEDGCYVCGWLLRWLDQEDGCYICGWQSLITALAGPGRWLLRLWVTAADYCAGWTRKMAVTSVADSCWLLRWLDQEDGCYVCGWQQLITALAGPGRWLLCLWLITALAGPGRWLLRLWLTVADYCGGWTRKMAVTYVADSSWLLRWLDQEDGCYVCGWQ